MTNQPGDPTILQAPTNTDAVQKIKFQPVRSACELSRPKYLNLFANELGINFKCNKAAKWDYIQSPLHAGQQPFIFRYIVGNVFPEISPSSLQQDSVRGPMAGSPPSFARGMPSGFS